MTMTNMQMAAEEAKECTEVCAKPGDGPRYPYGLCLYLDSDSLAKLGIATLPKVGSTLMLAARVTVTSVGMSQQQDGDAEMRTELQITDMELGGPMSNDQAAAKLFPNQV